MQRNPYQQYQTTQVKTASTGELVLLLYDAALRALTRAMQALEERNFEVAGAQLVRAQEIVMELNFGVDLEQGGELAVNLRRLYEFMYHHLLQANMKKDVEAVRHVAGLLEQLRGAWRVVVQGAPAAAHAPQVAPRALAGSMAA